MRKTGWCMMILFMFGLCICRVFAGEFQKDDNTLFLAHYNTTLDADYGKGNTAHDPLDSAFLTKTGGYFGGGLVARIGAKELEESGVDAKEIAASSGKSFEGLRYSSVGNLDLVKGTFECWYKPYFSVKSSVEGMITMHPIFGYRESAAKYMSLVFNHNTNGKVILYFIVVDSGVQPAAVVQIGVPVTWEPATWHHIAVTWDTMSEKPGTIALFLDGTPAGKQSLAGMPGGFLKPSEKIPYFAIGAHVWRGSGNPGNFNKADGVIDEVRISNIVR